MLIGREQEKKQLLSTLERDGSSFAAVYGRRRVGKTYMIREVMGEYFTFQHTGYYGGSTREQLFAFSASLKEAGLRDFTRPVNWLEAFELLKDLIRSSEQAKKVIFIDELSWMDSGHSDLMLALEGFWNGWASFRKDIVLIVCASATSWMLNKVVHNKGGLYNRLSFQIQLQPFNLKECEAYTKALGVVMNRHQLLECYMIMGGIPYYWGFLDKSMSLSQNIDAIFFSDNAPLRHEFRYLYASIFKKPEKYITIITALSRVPHGLDRAALLEKTGLTNSGAVTRQLEELEVCGFIRKHQYYGRTSRNSVYRLIDNYTLFYFKFLEKNPNDEHFWTNQLNMSARNAWCGLAFERVCINHVNQIKKALGISGVLTQVYTWDCKADPERGLNGSQIDLLIDRKDQVINLCEMKFSTQEYMITAKVDEELRKKRNDLIIGGKIKSAVYITLVTTYGLKNNSYAGNVQSVVTADDLFV